MDIKDPQYTQTRAIADLVFDQRITALSDEFKRVIERTAARGFSSLTGPAVGEMSEATMKAMRATSDELLVFYERALGEIPSVGGGTLDAVRSHLADHVCEQMESFASTFQGTVESHEGGRGMTDPAVADAVRHVSQQIRTRVAAIGR